MGKKGEFYDAAWSHIKSLLPDFKPTDAAGDFEIGAAKAAERQNPGCKVKFCLFHYCNCNMKHGQKHGLTKAFYDNPEYRRWLKLILAVPMLPAHLINEAFYLVFRKWMKICMAGYCSKSNILNYSYSKLVNIETSGKKFF